MSPLTRADRRGSDPGDIPVIGISCDVELARWGRWERRAALIPAVYVEAVARAGGRPALLPPIPFGARETVAALDGLLLSGGADIEAKRYGRSDHPTTWFTRPERDASELALLAEAERRDLPVLGICRGVEMMSVARGAPLEQHLPDRDGAGGEPTVHEGAPGQYVQHDVIPCAGSRLASIIGAARSVSSYHHQAPVRPGRGLVAGAYAPDGTLEAIEDPDRDFYLGVLWHPEFDGQLELFDALVAAARSYRKAKA
ncbi:MAG TPA: gamma-glutamyl-gamma-aminobutyrate hydrolase family protein [Jiangellaceae bacterium]|jgi:gamma-glutamyl-gamma-aminobutyrate hydrolase PuuD|nr:gamma-glutamyl-gamma-aminobutyrate hydrolase family protein [Jiangellaceae bacterium]